MRKIFTLLLLLMGLSLYAQSFEEQYRAFQQAAQKHYADFREQANAEYAEFLLLRRNSQLLQ